MTEPASLSVVIISKDEPALAETLACLRQQVGPDDEVIVVDASSGRLDFVRDHHPWVRWIPFQQPAGVRVTIPHQRNAGVREARGDIIAFTDCGCLPQDTWLSRLVAPLVDEGEEVACGPAISIGPSAYGTPSLLPSYVDSCPTINVAFRRSVFASVGGFDESFSYGSDIDFSWRVRAGGVRIRWVPDAVVRVDWGSNRRQMRRAFTYGAARARLYKKHRDRLRTILRDDPVPVLFPAFLLGLPLTFRYRWYPLLLLVPLWRNRALPSPLRGVADHLLQGAGLLAEIAGVAR